MGSAPLFIMLILLTDTLGTDFAMLLFGSVIIRYIS
jgi:hypothetical protein